MKKSIFLKISAITFLMAGVVFCGCSNSNDEPIEPVGPKTYTLTIEASKGGSAETRALEENVGSLVSTWETSDKVYVTKSGVSSSCGLLQPQSSGATATLSGKITGTFAQGDVLTFQYPQEAIDYTGQKGTLADISANYDYSVAEATVGQVGANAITVTGFTGFTNQQAIVKFTLKDILKDADGGLVNATSLTISAEGLQTKAGSEPGEITISPTSATSEYYVALSGISNTKISLTATVGSDTYFYERPNVTFENGKYYEVTVNMKNQSLYSEPLTFEAVGGGEINLVFHNLSGGTVEYKVNNGSWAEYPSNQILFGTKFSFRGNNASYYPDSENPSFFQCSADCYVYGNIMSLVNGKDDLGKDAFAHATELTGNDAFRELFKFKGSEGYLGKIKSNQNKPLLLPATTLAPNCYQSMFEGCTALERAPVLPARELYSHCYDSMFSGCESLSYIKCLATDISATDCTKNWVNGVAESGTFVSADGVNWSADVNGNPWGSSE